MGLWLVPTLWYVVAVAQMLIGNLLREVRAASSQTLLEDCLSFPRSSGNYVELAMRVREKEATAGEHGLKSS